MAIIGKSKRERELELENQMLERNLRNKQIRGLHVRQKKNPKKFYINADIADINPQEMPQMVLRPPQPIAPNTQRGGARVHIVG